MDKLNKKTLYIIIGLVMVACLVAEMAGIHLHQHWPLPYGYDIFFGFVGCWFLIIMAKIIMSFFLLRPENYYDGGEQDE